MLKLKTVKQWGLAIALAFVSFMAVILLSSMYQPPSINALYVFGDSLSDIGNAFRSTGGTSPPSPPYFQGRYSNGQVWVEYLAAELNLSSSYSTNFAYGGATTGGDSVITGPSLLEQVQDFTATHSRVNRDALFVVWAGANDYLQGTMNPERPVANIVNAIASLVDTGAQKILVANLPDLGRLPATRSTAYSSSLDTLTNAHNLGLHQALAALKQTLDSDVRIISLNVNALYRDAISNPAKYGFTNVTSACMGQQPTCRNPGQFLFWDEIHPTAAAHQILGNIAFTALHDERQLSSGFNRMH